jgi:hypothetical protein
VIAATGCSKASSTSQPISPAELVGANPPDRVVATMQDDRVIYFDAPRVQGGRLRGRVVGCYDGLAQPGPGAQPAQSDQAVDAQGLASTDPLDMGCVSRDSMGSVDLARVTTLRQTSYLPPAGPDTDAPSEGSDATATVGITVLVVAVGAAVVAGVVGVTASMGGGGWGLPGGSF